MKEIFQDLKGFRNSFGIDFYADKSNFVTSLEYKEINRHRIAYELVKISPKYTNIAQRFITCLKDHIILECLGCHNWYAVPINCRVRVCPYCARIYAHNVKRDYSDAIKQFRNAKHIVLTIQNIPFLYREVFDRIHKYLQKFFRRKTIRNRLRSAFLTISVHRTSKGYNYHIHILADMLYIKQADLSKIWFEISNSYIVYIKKITPRIALNYLIKHIINQTGFKTAKEFAYYISATYKKRLLVTYGVIRHREIDLFTIKRECPYCGCKLYKLIAIGNYIVEEKDGFSP